MSYQNRPVLAPGEMDLNTRRLLRCLLMPALRVAFRPRIVGLEHLPASGPFIVAANHLSFADHIFLSILCPRPIFFVGKAERLSLPGPLGAANAWFFRRVGMIPVVRDGGRGSMAALDGARAVLSRGDAVGIHPEGTRSPDGRLYRGHTGAAWLALQTGAPVVCCGLIGTDEVQRPGRLLLRPTRFEAHFGEPLWPTEFAGREQQSRTRREFTEQIMRSIASLSRQEYVPVHAVKGQALLQG